MRLLRPLLTIAFALLGTAAALGDDANEIRIGQTLPYSGPASGFGAIGRAIAKRAEAFGMSVCYHGPRRKEDIAYPYYPDLESLARESDCLVVACTATPGTRNLVNARILDALGPDGFLVNIARGSIVDEQALIAALRAKRIAGASLEVFWDEPRVPAELAAMEQVVLAPHIGSTTREIREERGSKLLANLRAHFSGQPVLNPIGNAG